MINKKETDFNFVNEMLSRTSSQIELRAFNLKYEMRGRLWTRDTKEIEDFINEHNGTNHIFFSTVTREDGGGGKEHCREVPWLWADIDYKSYDGGEKEAREIIENFEHRPSIINFTGGGLHCFWLIKDVLDAQEHLRHVEKALRVLSKMLNSDSSRTDITSMLRLPGTINPKPEYDSPVCQTEFVDLTRVISLDDICPKSGPTKTTKTQSEEPLKLSPLQLAEKIYTEFDEHIIFFNQSFKVYGKGYWKDYPEVMLRKKIANLDRPNTSSYRTMDALQVIKDLNPIVKEKIKQALICLINGVLDPTNGRLLPHSPDYHFFNQIPIVWDPEAKCPIWDKTLMEIFEPDSDSKQKRRLLRDWFGYCLIPDTSMEKFLWLVGEGGNGKSLILHILNAIVGLENVSHIMLTRLGRAFVRAELEGKLVNISPEMKAEDTISDNYLKAIVSGDRIEAERKLKPSFSFKPYCRLIGSTNQLPRLLDLSRGFQRRAIILEFNRVFKEEEQDRKLINKLQEELPGILAWAVRGLQLLVIRKSFSIPESCENVLTQYLIESDPVKQFAEENLKVNDCGRLTGTQIFQEFDVWARDNGFRRLNITTMGKRLKSLGYLKRHSNGKELWCLEWIQLYSLNKNNYGKPVVEEDAVDSKSDEKESEEEPEEDADESEEKDEPEEE